MVLWDAIILTCCQNKLKSTYEKELNRLQALGLLSQKESCLVQCLEDPVKDVGSGGATLNAILRTVEYLSASEGLTVLDCDVLKEKKVIIFLDGRPSLFDCAGMTFSSLGEHDEGHTISPDTSNFYHLYSEITQKVANNCPNGIWIVSMDMILYIEEEFSQDWDNGLANEHVIAFSFPVDHKFAKENGVYSVENDYVEDIIYKDSIYCDANSTPFHSVCGLLFFSHQISERILMLHLMPSFEGCTYLGIDNGAKPVKLSLFFDLLSSMSSKCSHVKCVEAKFLQDNNCNTKTGLLQQSSLINSGDQKAMESFEQRSRLLREHFSVFRIRNVMLTGSVFYSSTSASDYQNFLKELRGKNVKYSTQELNPDSLHINSLLHSSLRTTNSLIIDCEINSPLIISSLQIKECILFGLHSQLSEVLLNSPDHHEHILEKLCISCYPLLSPNSQPNIYAILVFSLSDFSRVDDSYIMNIPLNEFMKQRGIEYSDLWDDNVQQKSAMTAKLFPTFDEDDCCSRQLNRVFYWLLSSDSTSLHASTLSIWRQMERISIQEILLRVDVERILVSRRNLLHYRIENEVCDVLRQGLNRPVNHLFKLTVVDNQVGRLLRVMDSLHPQVESSLTLVARLLATIADLLGCAAQNKGGLRSGPAANPNWLPAFTLLDGGEYKAGLELMQSLRADWLNEANLLIRCSRHYEMASQIIIRHAVCTARDFIREMPLPIISCRLPKCVRVDCPARIDLAGGWSDTPPICYEHGGLVVNMSVRVNECKPITCWVTRTNEHDGVLIVNDEESQGFISISSLDDLFNYDKPYIEGALVKAVLTFVGWQIKSEVKTLSEFMTGLFQCSGLNINLCSKLPKGSGLGASSILGGGLLTALWRLQGRNVDTLEVIHAVLVIEQMMTTGGGWQDQVGGLCPGVSWGKSAPTLPLKVEVDTLKMRHPVDNINDRFLLVYTGMTRLARNLLQEVIRNWYARTPQIMEVVDGLHKNANDCQRALIKGDLTAVGKCLDITWNQKKLIARGCEPHFIGEVMTVLRPFCDGMSLTGAGGGGFLVAVLKELPDCRGQVLHALDQFNKESSRLLKVCSFTVDEEGLRISVVESD